MFDGTFWLSMAGIIAAFLGGVITALNKSKCSNMICCCGMLQCVRDVKTEAEIEEHRIDMQMPDTPTATTAPNIR